MVKAKSPEPEDIDVVTNKQVVEVKFSVPQLIAGQEIKSVILRKPKIRDHLAAEKSVKNGSEFEKELFVFATCCSYAPNDFLDLDEDEYRKIRDAYSNFF